MAENKKVVVIKNDVLVPIEISKAYYDRVYQLTTKLLEKQPDLQQTLTKLDTPGSNLTLEEYTISVFMSLIKSVEEVCLSDKDKYTEEVLIPDNSTES